jgi:hypothetical protein
MKKSLENTLYWLASRDASFFQILIGYMIALVGLVITYYFARSADYHCTRVEAGEIRCSITQKLLGFQTISKSWVDHIQMAEVEQNSGSDGNSTYRVIFVTRTGRVSLTSYFSSDYSPKANLVNQVNNFINSGQQPVLEVQENIAWWKWLFFFGFTGLGVAMILITWKKFLSSTE